MTLTQVSAWQSFGGTLSVHDHESALQNCTMRFAVYTPSQADPEKVPVLWYLSGLTCSWANVMEKSGLQRAASRHGIMIIAPDTSPRGDDVPDDEAYDLGQGAGFYLTATQEPWAKHYKMDQYITDELTKVIAEHFPYADMDRQGIFGHSMGGHGAITLRPRLLFHCDLYGRAYCPSCASAGGLGAAERLWLNLFSFQKSDQVIQIFPNQEAGYFAVATKLQPRAGFVMGPQHAYMLDIHDAHLVIVFLMQDQEFSHGISRSGL